MAAKVKDCPFCGAGGDDVWVSENESGIGGLGGTWEAFCSVCRARGGEGDTKAEARKNWNRRAKK